MTTRLPPWLTDQTPTRRGRRGHEATVIVQAGPHTHKLLVGVRIQE
jgi:hypothetical protein